MGKNPLGFIYFVVAKGCDRVKIGFSTNPKARMRSLQMMSAVPLCLVAKIQATQADEHHLHKWLKADRVHGEWFRQSKDVNNAIATALHMELGSDGFGECLKFVEQELEGRNGANARA